MEVFYILLLGVSLGSHLNVLALHEVSKNRKALFSHCPHCRRQLMPMDLIPVLSYLLLRGKCRWCHQPIAIRYLLVELIMGGITFLVWKQFGLSAKFLVHVLFAMILFVIALIDLDTMEISHRWLWWLVLVSFFHFFTCPQSFLSIGLGALVMTIPFACFYWKGLMGGGDVKLIAAAGLFLGMEKIIFACLTAFISGGVIAVWLLLSKRYRRKSAVPFAPFLSFGCIVLSLIDLSCVDCFLDMIH